ncbi:membrane protein insertion efficiency factor YidD [Nanchangia anserum]|uniref:Putative membrane protein insertion efficiency factor n=1 Tax=Nanchangia anserum TaxID=2692125 RepID=A0A8I0KNT6_9ACTO|nr:membrane protein insertion efficiency factor YidD [Nanchangia anserum]MBD3689631.1 membrane protein insertion efficiency factor YidD [Nanchangia anserum]QOX81815.1 membrane protein insertion efficiency factor YidD [Nanchangia anserum]
MGSPVAWACALPIRGYRRWISPMLPPRCKYYPTCSSYALDCLRIHGTMKGALLILWRLARCNPWSMGGVDLPPLPGQWRGEPARRMSDEELRDHFRHLDEAARTCEAGVLKERTK